MLNAGGNEMNFHEKLYDLRKSSGLTQEEMAERLEVSRQTISNWETGSASPSLDKALELSELFSVSLDELVGRKKTKQHAISEILLSLLNQRVTIHLAYDEDDIHLFGESTYKDCQVIAVNERSMRILVKEKKQEVEKLLFLKNILSIESEVM